MDNMMTSKERVMAAIKGFEMDCVPVISTSMGINNACMDHSGAYFPEAYYNAQKIAALAETGHTVIGFDSISPYFSAHLEAAALGCQIEWGDAYRVPVVKSHSLLNLEDFCAPASFPHRPPCTALLKAIQILNKKYKSTVPIIGKVIGPWSLSYFLYGVDNLTMDLILNPQKLQSFFKQLADCAIDFAEAQFNAGADIITLIDHVNSDYFNPASYLKYILPIHKYISARLARSGPVIWTIFGDVSDRFDLISEAGFPVLHILPSNNIPLARQIIGDKMLVIGSINNPDILVNGSAKDVRRAVSHSIQTGSRLIAPEAAISTKTPTANLIEMVQAAHSVRWPII